VPATDLILYLNWAVFLGLFARVLAQAIRRPWRINVNVALLFGVPALSALINLGSRAGLLPAIPEIRNIITALLLLLALLLFRLVDDVVIVDGRARRFVGAATLLLALAVGVTPAPQPAWLAGTALAAVFALFSYSALAFRRAARLASGVTRRRMQVIAIGSLLFVSTFLISWPALVFPALRDPIMLVANSCGLAAGLCYFVGFAPPRLLRRAWQEPELRAFLSRAAQLPRLSETEAIVAELERGAASALGAPRATLVLWTQDGTLEVSGSGGATAVDPAGPTAIARAWREQRSIFAERGRQAGVSVDALEPGGQIAAALVAPVTAGETRLGVLAVLAARVPIFAAEDLALVQLLADQAAVILESRALIDEAARVRSHAEANRLKEEFLAAAAHDLKTPLTALLGRAELMARRAARNPDAPADQASIQVLVREGHRLRRLVHELLDASRVEEGQLAAQRSPVDIVALARAVCERHATARHPCSVTGDLSVAGMYDAIRIEQLLENLVENAVKYSPAGGAVGLDVRLAGDEVRISVSDEGIGIPEADLPRVFERFHRAANATGLPLAGMGLGLFICHAIAEQHGGRIEVNSQAGVGTIFRVSLPYVPVEQGHGISA
jgi:signal transduction histidine kinase